MKRWELKSIGPTGFLTKLLPLSEILERQNYWGPNYLTQFNYFIFIVWRP